MIKFRTAFAFLAVLFGVSVGSSFAAVAAEQSSSSSQSGAFDDATATEPAPPMVPKDAFGGTSHDTVSGGAPGADACASRANAPPPPGTPPKDMKKFTDWLFGYDDINTPSASTLAGLAYLKGKGAKQDFARARELFQKAVQVSDGAGTTQLGLMYLRGTGVEKDPKKANEFLKHASEYGIWYPGTGNENNGDAQYELGIASDTGVGLSKNVGNAYMWFKLASESISDNKSQAAAKLQEIISRLTPEEKDQYDQQLAVWKENQKIAITPEFTGADPGPKN